MNKKFISACVAVTALGALASHNNQDPVIMTVDGNDIRLSEFQYLYNKNNSQQLQPLTFDEYVNMFVDYKLKVADAHAMGVDTTAAFRQEFDKFRDELAMPFLSDSEEMERLVENVYSHLGEEVYVSHIMLGNPTPQNPNPQAQLDSIRNLILTDEMTFEEAANKYSVDKNSAVNGGRMGWVVGNSRLPWQFEDMSYDTPVGEISPVVNSGFGYHIIRPEERRRTRGEVHTQHILVLTRDMDADAVARQKQRIDSIYRVVTTPGVNFSEVAMSVSEDPGSAKRGGDLGWYGSGRMVQEFDSVSFALADGEISKPFATAYGYHIIHKLGHRGDTVPPLEQVRPTLEKAISGDSRAQLPIATKINTLAKATNSTLTPDLDQKVSQYLKNKGYVTFDSAALAALKNSAIQAFTVNGQTVDLGQVLANKQIRLGADPDMTGKMIANVAKNAYDQRILDYGKEQLMATNPEYRNLVNEYRDGIMLFEVSNQKVWDKASKDKEGLEAYFKSHKDQYKWDAPKYKAYVIFASNDSIMQLAENYLKDFNPASMTQEDITNNLKKRFNKDVKIERVIAAQGENPITDYLGFGAPKPENKNQRWPSYFAFDGKVIGQPEEAADVRGAVVTDYQNELEKQWLEELHKKYTVKINQKELKKAK